ncbi:MAG: DNA repair protein RecO [Acidobacteria bacterium]|nr:DNA repair protein RecO [Acidobacteriota bacterium]MBU4253658.1 DNA repair protein RecO [Acidobacteriota bacterium]
MAIERSEALILQTGPFSEQDKLITFFTREKGILRGIAKGARKFGNRFGSSLEPPSHVFIVYYEKEGRDLVTVSQCELQESFFDLQCDSRVSFSLCYYAELVQEFVPLHSREDILFRLLLRTLQALKKGGELELLSAYFEAWLLRAGGLEPDLRACGTCGGALVQSAWLSPRLDGALCDGCAAHKKDIVPAALHPFIIWTKKNPPPTEPVSDFTPEELQGIRKFFQRVLIYHVERVPKSLRFLS